MKIFDKNEIISHETMIKILMRSEHKSKNEISEILEEHGLKYFTNQLYTFQFGKYFFSTETFGNKADLFEQLSTELLSKTIFLAEGQFIPRECVIEVLNKYGAEIKEGE